MRDVWDTLPATPPGRLLGVEQEFDVREDGGQVDFRRFIHRAVNSAGRAVCGAGPSGYYLRSGQLLICDGWEAEVACPPQPVAPDLFEQVPRVVGDLQRELLEHLASLERDGGPALSAFGYSTHLSVSSTGVDLIAFSRLYARSMAPAMMLLLDRSTSPGLLVRARHRRFEIGSDYAAPEDLRAASLFFVSSFLAVLEALVSGDHSRLPLLFDDSRLEPARQRSGFYVDRRAFGDDLYDRGRNARLRLDRGGVIGAQAALEALWEHVRDYARLVGTVPDVELASALLTGSRPLPCESCDERYAAIRPTASDALPARAEPFAWVLQSRTIAGRTFTPEVVTWDYVAYRVEDAASVRYLNVPRAAQPQWLDAIDANRTDQWFAGLAPDRPLLSSEGEAETIGFFAAIDAPALTDRFEGRDPGKKKKERDDHECQVIEENGIPSICMPEVTDSARVLVEQEPAQGCHLVGNGIPINNGSFFNQHVDHRVRGRGLDFAFLRYYRSGIEYSGPLGRNWDHAYNVRIVAHPPPTAQLRPGGWCEPFSPATSGGSVTYYHGTGRITEHAFASWEIRDVAWCGAVFTAIVTTYAQNDGDSFEIQRYAILEGSPPPGIQDPIFFRVMCQGGTRFLLNCRGRLMEIRDRNHNKTRCVYGRFFDPDTRWFKLWKVIDSLGRTHEFDYLDIGGAPRIVSLVDKWQRVVRFEYDPDVNLERVTLAAGDAGTPVIQYKYGGGQRDLLREIVDPVEVAGTGRSWLENTYDSSERVIRQRVGSTATSPPAGGTYKIAYPAPTQVILTDRAGTDWTYTLRPLGSSKVVERIVVFDQTGTGGQVTTSRLESRFEYDRHYHVTRIVYPSQRQETFRYRNRNAQVFDGDELDDALFFVAHHNDLGRDALLIHSSIPSSGAGGFVTVYDYEWLFSQILTIQSSAGRTEFTYDHGHCAAPEYNGNPIRIERPPQRLPDGSTLPVVDDLDYGPGGTLAYLRDPDGVEHDWLIDASGLIREHTIGGEVVEKFTYTPRGNVETRTDPRGKTWRYDYDDRDLLRTTTDPMRHVATTVHNLNDWQTNSWMDRIDDPGPIVGLAAPPPVRVSHMYGYDVLGNRIAEVQLAQGPTVPAVRLWRWTFDAEERVTLVESPRATSGERADARVRSTYNARGLLASKTTSDGGSDAGTVTTYYDDDGMVAIVEDEFGQRTVTSYDRHGRRESELRPNGATHHWEYRGPWLWREWVEGPMLLLPPQLGGSAVQRVLSEVQFSVDARGRQIRRTTKIFDPAQRPSISSGGGGDWTESTWLSAAGRLKRQKDPAGHETLFAWDPQGRMKTVTLPGLHALDYGYEGSLMSEITTTLKPDGGVTGPLPPTDLVLKEKRTYDDLGRLIRHRSPENVEIEYAYDSTGQMRAKRSPILEDQSVLEYVLTQFEYDTLGRLETQITDRIASASNPDATMKLRFQSDLNDNITTLTDDLGRTTKATFDGRDLPLTSQQPQQSVLTYQRRKDGSVETITRGTGSTSAFRYGRTGMLENSTHVDGGATLFQAFGYDGLDRMLWATDSNGGAPYRVQSYRSIDSLGRVLSTRTVIPEFSFDNGVTYDYTPGERVMRYPDGSRVTHTVDGDGNVKRISVGSARVVLEALHQGPGRVLQQQSSLVLSASQPQPARWDLTLRTSQRYDAEGRPNFRTLHVTDPIIRPTPLDFLTLGAQAEKTTYEENGMPRTRTFGVITQPGIFVDSTYVYDGLGRARLITEGEGSDFVNLDYNWDGAGRLHDFELTGRTGGQIVNQITTMTHLPGQRIDELRDQGNLVSTTTWTFDAEGRLTASETTQPDGRRDFKYDAAGRLAEVDVTTQGFLASTVETSQFLYDAFGRIVARVDGSDPEFFVSDGTNLIAEFDAQMRATRRYVYDDRRRLIHYSFLDSNGTWQSCLPLVTAEGTPWILVADRPAVDQLPAPPAAGAAAVTRARYYRENLPLILEEHRWRPFEKGQVISYDYSSGTADSTLVDASVLPIDTGGRRYFARERLFANGPRFYDPQLRSFIVPDELGAWGHPMAFGNPYAYAANNPVVFGDDGNVPLVVVVGVLAVFLVGATVGIVFNIARQSIQILEGSRDDFSPLEVGFSGLMGGGLALGLVFAPELTIPAMVAGAGMSGYQYATGQIGGWTLAFDLACLGVAAGVKGVQAARAPKSVPRTAAPSLRANLAERFARFGDIGQKVMRPFDRVRRHFSELRREESLLVDEDTLTTFRGELLGEGREGRVFALRNSDQLVLKEFHDAGRALDNLNVLEMLYLAMQHLGNRLGPHRLRIPRVHAIGRTTSGRSFMIRERVTGSFTRAHAALEGRGVGRLSQAFARVVPEIGNNVIPLENNVLMMPDGTLVVFDL